MFRPCCALGFLLVALVFNLDEGGNVRALRDLGSIKGGSEYYCAFPYPQSIGGCANCVPAGTRNTQPPGMPPMYVPVWRRCLTSLGDDLCFVSPDITSRCIKTETDCPPVHYGIYVDASCINIFTTNSEVCGRTYIAASSGAQFGVDCSEVTPGPR